MSMFCSLVSLTPGPSPKMGRGDGGEGFFYHSNFSIFLTTQYVSRVKMPMGPQ